MASASVRACESYKSVQRAAERLGDELEDVTSPGGIPITNLDDEDSMVVAVDRVLKANGASGG